MNSDSRVPRIAESEVELRFVRASGPGGQNVNKVATAVELRFHIGSSRSLTEEVKNRLRKLAGRRVSDQDILVIDAQRFRSQEANRRDALGASMTWCAPPLIDPNHGSQPSRLRLQGAEELKASACVRR